MVQTDAWYLPCIINDFAASDLLAHHPFVQDEHAKPVSYSRVEWWDHPPGVDVVVGKR